MFAPSKTRRNIRRQTHGPSTQSPPADALKFELYTAEELDSLILPDFTTDSELGILLRSHLSPTDSQRAQFQDLQRDSLRQAASFDSLSVKIDREVSELEDEIKKLRLRATNLRERSEEAGHNHRRLQALLAPIRVLPPEIMSEIFLACLGPTVLARTNESPLLLCRVCSAWRAIALSTPQLWATLTFTGPNIQKLASTSVEWFSHSGTLPLSLRLRIPSFYLPGNSFVPPSQWSRLRDLEVELESARHVSALLDRFSDVGLASVERLSISAHEPIRHNPSNLPAMPNLRKLLISGMVWFHGSLRHLPWNQLTHISSRGYSMHSVDWRSLIRECTSLRHGSFTIAMGSSPQENTGTNTRVSLLHLLSLKIVFATKGGWSLLAGLSFPSLLSLTLGTVRPEYYKHEGLSLWHAPTFAQISVHSLETLVLVNVSIRKESLIAFLRTTPKLTSFTGDFPFDYGPLLEELSVLPNEEGDDANAPRAMPFLPILSKLLIYQSPSKKRRTYESKVHFDVGLLTQVVRTRWRPRPSIPTQLGGDLNPGGLTSVIIRSLEEGTLLKAQITTALRPFSRQGLIVGVDVEPKGYQFDLDVDW